MKRLFWFVVGACAGAYAVLWGKRKAAHVAESITPEAVMNALVDGVRALIKQVVSRIKGTPDDPPPSVL